MTAIEYIFVPKDGTSERSLSGREAASQKFIEDSAVETRISELLGQRGIEVPLWVVEGGYMIHGNVNQARVVSRLAGENIFPTASAEAPRHAQPVQHITAMFGDAAVNIRLRANFDMAAGESRVVPFGRKPSIRGNYGLEIAA